MSWKHIWAAASAAALAASLCALPALAQNQPANSPAGAPAASPSAASQSTTTTAGPPAGSQPATGQPATGQRASGHVRTGRAGAHGAPGAVQAALPAAQPSAPVSNSEGVAAIVNDQVISSYDVRQRAQLLLVSAGIQSSPEMMQRASEQALRDLEDEHLQIQETSGDPYHITIPEADIDRRVADIAHQNHVTPEEFAHRLAASGINISTLRSQIRADVAWQRLMSGLYGSRIRISETEIRDTQARIAASSTATHYLISEIFLPASTPQEFAQAQDGGMRLLEQMQQGAAFPLVARQFSGAPSAAAGGDIGWIAGSELPAEVANVVARLQPGQVSLPIRTPTGVYIVALRDKHDGAPQGSTSMVTLKELTAPTPRRAMLDRLQRRANGCNTLDHDIEGLEGVQAIDLGQTSEADLSPEIHTRVQNVATGGASSVEVAGDQASVIFVCGRDTGGAGIPSRQDIENRLFEQELSMLSERYLNNLRRQATIITR
jgi:peptidyl-prolyl cis-trans isomerase SurA